MSYRRIFSQAGLVLPLEQWPETPTLWRSPFSSTEDAFLPVMYGEGQTNTRYGPFLLLPRRIPGPNQESSREVPSLVQMCCVECGLGFVGQVWSARSLFLFFVGGVFCTVFFGVCGFFSLCFWEGDLGRFFFLKGKVGCGCFFFVSVFFFFF